MPADQQRVRFGAQGGFFEFGWVIGWSNCAGHRDHFFHEATLFAWWSTSTGVDGCRVWEKRHPAGGQFHQFRGSDIPSPDGQNTYWGAWINGEELQPNGVNLDFGEGVGIVAMERGDDADSGFTRWTNLDEWHNSNGWTNWNDLTLDGDSDPDYHLRIDAPDKGTTVQ